MASALLALLVMLDELPEKCIHHLKKFFHSFPKFSKDSRIETYQNMPHIFISSFKGTEANTDAKQTLAAPVRTRLYQYLPHGLTFAAVDHHLNRTPDILL